MAKVTIEIDDRVLEIFKRKFTVDKKYKDDFCIDGIGKDRIVEKVIEHSINERWGMSGTALEYMVADEYTHYNKSGVMYDLLYEISLEEDKY